MPQAPAVYKAPATFYIFNGKKLKSIAAPPNALNDSSYNVRLLMLPTGQVMECDDSSDVEIYAERLPLAGESRRRSRSVPTTLAAGSTYKIKGRRFNGVSQANFYGDDVQQATNYPLVRITNNGRATSSTLERTDTALWASGRTVRCRRCSMFRPESKPGKAAWSS